MPVLEAMSVTLEVPRLDEGIKFYTDAGLNADSTESVSRLQCAGQPRDAIVLLGGAPRKRLHHITLRADHLEEIAGRTPAAGGTVVEGPARGLDGNWLWGRGDPGSV